MIQALVSILFLLTVLIVFGTAAWAGLVAAPWVPVRARDVKRMISLAGVNKGQTVIDLGSGDGRLLLEAAQRGANAIGYEISVLPYVWSKIRIAIQRKAEGTAKVLFKDFYSQRMGEADVVVAFLTPPAMARLGPKLHRELRSGARVASYAFSIPGWIPDHVDKPTSGQVSIYVYTVPRA